jgi:hypothetical protein
MNECLAQSNCIHDPTFRCLEEWNILYIHYALNRDVVVAIRHKSTSTLLSYWPMTPFLEYIGISTSDHPDENCSVAKLARQRNFTGHCIHSS